MGIPTIAPKKELARIEGSKGFARQLLQTYGIGASPKFRIFTAATGKRDEMYKFIDQELHRQYVVKYDALKGGKGVKICGDHLGTIEDGIQYAEECIRECGQVVIEEKLEGVEFSLMSFVAGTRVADMPVVHDHKRAFDGDQGPNTGGMGTITDADHSLPFLTKADLDRAKEINRRVAEALFRECGEPYEGILYGGYMAVKDGVRVIEFNSRFGDPEALNVLPLLTSDFVDICQAIVDDTLTEGMVRFERKATVCTYITPQSYPEAKNERGKVVSFPEIPEHARLYYGDIAEDDEGVLHLGGSRSAGIVGIADTIAEAESITRKLCGKVEGPVRFRSDIGTEGLMQQRINTMKRIRSA
jgi:phosphoribosylamine--glycine ligase